MSKRRRTSGNRRVAEAKFWGPAGEAADPETHRSTEGADADGGAAAPTDTASSQPSATVMVRPTPDPGALVRSLGPPPLAVDAGLAERHLTAVYEEAVRTATALAAANGLLAGDTDES